MDCEEVRHSLSLYAQGRLPARERAAIARHLAGCDACRLEFERIQQEDQLLRDYLSSTPMLDQRERVTSQVRARTSRPSRNGHGEPPHLLSLWNGVRRHAALIGVLAGLALALSAFALRPTLAQSLIRYIFLREVPADDLPTIATELPLPPELWRTVGPPTAVTTVLPRSSALWMDIADIEREAGFSLLLPRYLPPGCEAQDRYYDQDNVRAKLYYTCGLYVDQQKSAPTNELIGSAERAERIELRGAPALYVNGDWAVDDATGEFVWREGPQQLWFERGDVLVHMAVTLPDALSREAFLRIAESME